MPRIANNRFLLSKAPVVPTKPTILTFDPLGNLTYTTAAVPEPESYALLLADMGLVGTELRRRKVGCS